MFSFALAPHFSMLRGRACTDDAIGADSHSTRTRMREARKHRKGGLQSFISFVCMATVFNFLLLGCSSHGPSPSDRVLVSQSALPELPIARGPLILEAVTDPYSKVRSAIRTMRSRLSFMSPQVKLLGSTIATKCPLTPPSSVPVDHA